MTSATLKQTFSAPLIHIAPEDPMAAAARLMSQHNIRHLPVIREKILVGILSERDVRKAAGPGFYPLGTESVQSADFNPQLRVQDCMSWPVETIDKEASIGAAAEKMLERKISSLVVTMENYPVGIVTTEDLLRFLVEDFNDGTKVATEEPLAPWQSLLSRPLTLIMDEMSLSGV